MSYTKNDIEKEIESDDILGLVKATVKNKLMLTDVDCVAMVNQTGVTLTQCQENQEFSITGSWKAINRAYKLLVEVRAGIVRKQGQSPTEQTVHCISEEKIHSSIYDEDHVIDIHIAAEEQVPLNSSQVEGQDIDISSETHSEITREDPGITGLEPDEGVGEDHEIPVVELTDHEGVDPDDRDEEIMEENNVMEISNQTLQMKSNSKVIDSSSPQEVDSIRNVNKSEFSDAINCREKCQTANLEPKMSDHITCTSLHAGSDDSVNLKGQSNPFICHICGKGFSKKRYLNCHVKRHEESSKKFKCQICGWGFFERHKLRIHLETHKPSDQQSLPYKCSVCDKQFHNKAGWSDHMNSHEGKRPWKCDYCEATFAYRGALKRHHRVHNAKQYRCKTCNKEFAYQENLDSHMSIHTGVTSHVCPCGKAYTVGASLKRHQEKCKEQGNTAVTHSTSSVDVIYVCGVCNRAFETVTEVETHALTHCQS